MHQNYSNFAYYVTKQKIVQPVLIQSSHKLYSTGEVTFGNRRSKSPINLCCVQGFTCTAVVAFFTINATHTHNSTSSQHCITSEILCILRHRFNYTNNDLFIILKWLVPLCETINQLRLQAQTKKRERLKFYQQLVAVELVNDPRGSI